MYESQTMTFDQSEIFINYIDMHLGTEYERNKLELDSYYVIVMDLESPKDLQTCRDAGEIATATKYDMLKSQKNSRAL